MASNTSIADPRGALAAALVLAALALASPADAPAQDEVRIDLSTDAAKKIGLWVEAMQASGVPAQARPLAVEADGILARDLDYSGLFAVSKSWDAGAAPPPDAQAVVTGRVTLSGSSVTLTGELRDFPARRLIARTDYKGTRSELRRLVHRFADDVALHLTGEAGVATTRIAYVQKGKGMSELWVVDFDGNGARPLTAFKSPLTSPSWGPGGLVAFAALRGAAWNLYAVPTGGGPSRQLSRGGSLNHAPSIAPDGAVAFASNRDGNSEIYVSGADGSAPRRLTVNRAIDTSPSWSPNGQRIAFTSDRGGSAQVWVMDRDGGNQRRLVSGFSYSDSPDWAPKGDRIAFVVRTGGGFDVYVAGADGSNPRAIVTGGSNENPHWSPDGRLIVYSSNRGGSRGIWVTDQRGQSQRQLAVSGPAVNPAWSPRPSPSPSTTAGGANTTNPGR